MPVFKAPSAYAFLEIGYFACIGPITAINRHSPVSFILTAIRAATTMEFIIPSAPPVPFRNKGRSFTPTTRRRLLALPKPRPLPLTTAIRNKKKPYHKSPQPRAQTFDWWTKPQRAGKSSCPAQCFALNNRQRVKCQLVANFRIIVPSLMGTMNWFSHFHNLEHCPN